MVMAVKSAERVLQIFELLEGAPGGMTNKDISQSLGFAPSSTLGILQTMLEYGYLMIDEGKRYSLGGKLVRLGDIAASRFDIGENGISTFEASDECSGGDLFSCCSFRR